jgi:hypothetical protein
VVLDAEGNVSLEQPVSVWETWLRAVMGLKSSPYQAVQQGLSFAEEVILGDRKNPANLFQWDRIRRNLPGSEHYDPKLP